MKRIKVEAAGRIKSDHVPNLAPGPDFGHAHLAELLRSHVNSSFRVVRVRCESLTHPIVRARWFFKKLKQVQLPAI